MFISFAYPDSISDQEISKQSSYLDMMKPHTELMVDKGFNISNDFAAKRIYVVVHQKNEGRVRCCLQKSKKEVKLQKQG